MQLTEKQEKRWTLYNSGMGYEKIAKMEGVNKRAIQDSIAQVKKKMGIVDSNEEITVKKDSNEYIVDSEHVERLEALAELEGLTISEVFNKALSAYEEFKRLEGKYKRK